MPRSSAALVFPALEDLANNRTLTPEYRISRLLAYAGDFTLRIASLSMLTTRMASQLGMILTKLDTTKSLSRTDGSVVSARQLMYSYNKQRDELYLVPDIADEPEYGLGLVRLLLLAIPSKRGEAGFNERVTAIRAINELVAVIASKE